MSLVYNLEWARVLKKRSKEHNDQLNGKRGAVTAFLRFSLLDDRDGNKITTLIFDGKNRIDIVTRELNNKTTKILGRQQIIAF